MEIFKITCVTCQARLSVRNPAIIGQIVACPRCDSMVQIEAPAASADAIAPETVAPESVQNVPTEPVAPDGFEEIAVEPTPEMSTAEPAEVSAVEEVSSHAGSVVARVIAKYKLVAWTLASVAVGAAVGGAVILFRGSPVEVAAKTKVVASQTEPASIDLPTGAAEETELAEEEPTPQVADVEPVAIVEGTDDEPIASEETPRLPALEENEPVESLRVANRFDTLDLDPDLLDLEMLKSAAGESVAEAPAADLPDTDIPDTDEVPGVVEAAEVSTLPAVRRDPEQNQNKATQSAEKRLAQVFPAIAVKAMPVGDFLDLISRLGGIPVSVAPEQLQMAGITARKSVSLDAKKISLAESLAQVLDPLHLEYVAEGPHVVVVRQGASKIREMEYPLDDLATATVTAEEIVDWVDRFVLPAAGPFELEASATTLRLEQPQELQYRVLIFLERLRLSRNLRPRSRFPVKRLAGSSAHAALAERLRSPVTFTFSHYTALNDIVRYWQQELDTPILVDWPALGEVDLWPDTRVICAVENKSWSAAFDLVLEPLGLGWRAATGGVIEITSSGKVRDELKLELYQLRRKLGDDEERVLGELRSFTSKQPAGIAYDRTGKLLIVYQPAAAQRLVYQWLVDEKLSAID